MARMLLQKAIFQHKVANFSKYLACPRFLSSQNDASVRVERSEVKSFIQRCMTKVGTKDKHAEALADNLTTADHRGHFSHGLNRLDMYVNDIKSGVTISNEEPMILRETAATAHVDGQNVLGPVVGNFCMQLVITKAKQAGIGWVVAKGSNHYGIAGFYSLQASRAGLLGMSFTNTSPLVLPTRARSKALGTNPLTLAAPGENGDGFCLDMATSAVALGKIELSQVKNEKIPKGWGADEKGLVSEDPREVTATGGLLPLGGAELTGGYKGYGLSMLVEVFCGILAGAEYGPNIRRWKNTTTVANLGQCFVAIDPYAFEPGFENRMQDLMDRCRNMPLAEGETHVMVAGDPEKKHMAQCDSNGGIPYHPNVIENLNKLASSLGVNPIVTK